MFRWYLKKAIRRGRMVVVEPNGRITALGESGAGPAVTIRIADQETLRRINRHPNLALGEAYMDGGLTVENGTIRDLLDIIFDNLSDAPPMPQEILLRPFRPLVRRIQQYNPARRAERNVAHHYDLSSRLYELFLDTDRQYSCAYFSAPDMTLEAAQEAKKRHIAAKLLLKPGLRVLDIGSGWGGLALTLAQIGGVDVTGLTLSREQLAASNARAQAMGLGDRVRFHLRDYRAETGTYDRIVSVGMFEHVGVNHYTEFFNTAKRLLAPEGVMLCYMRSDGGPALAAPTSGSANISSPAAMPRPFRKCCRLSSRPGSSRPISNCCAFITPRRWSIGSSGSRPTESRSPHYMTSASAGCGNSIWREPRWTSAISARWSSRFN